MTTTNPMEPVVKEAEGEVPHAEWHPLWSSQLARPWITLAVIAVDPGTDASRVAEVLASVGNRLGARSVRIVSTAGATATEARGVLEQLTDVPPGGDHVLVTCDPLRANPAMLPILQAVSGVVLVVRLGSSLIASAKQIVDAVGRERVFATVAIG